MEAELPDKIYFKIGEVARITDLKPSVIRFWESEFNELRPAKSRSGQRVYTHSDIKLLLQVKAFLYSERLTIEGARSRLAQKAKSGESDGGSDQDSALRLLRDVKAELQQLYSMM